METVVKGTKCYEMVTYNLFAEGINADGFLSVEKCTSHRNTHY